MTPGLVLTGLVGTVTRVLEPLDAVRHIPVGVQFARAEKRVGVFRPDKGSLGRVQREMAGDGGLSDGLDADQFQIIAFHRERGKGARMSAIWIFRVAHGRIETGFRPVEAEVGCLFRARNRADETVCASVGIDREDVDAFRIPGFRISPDIHQR